MLETPYRIEPCFPEHPTPEVLDACTELALASQHVAPQLHAKTCRHLAGLVRVMNCYYSNLIEGHNTTPREIEQALFGTFDATEERRHLQLEARAHITLQGVIDQLFLEGTLPEPASQDFIRFLHNRFYAEMPTSLLTLKGVTRTIVMSPGVYRQSKEDDVTVGRHVPPTGGVVADFMAHFESRFRFASLGASKQLIAFAAAHHRLNYIHPFPDGNGRVSRLMSHAMGLKAGIGAHGLWSISRGLARGLESRGEYKQMMDYGDTPRQGALDGRGNLSEKALNDFVAWFLRVALDQVRFMSTLFDLGTFADRLKRYQETMGWRTEAFYLLEQALLRGELPRGEAERLTGLKTRTARDLLKTLTQDGILQSDTPKGPVSLRFPVHSVEILFPQLFPKI